MITNATILSITTPSAIKSTGGRTAGETASMSVRCNLSAPRREQLPQIAKVAADAHAVLYAPISLSSQLVPRCTLSIRLDGMTAESYQIMHRTPQVKGGGLSHVEAFLKTA